MRPLHTSNKYTAGRPMAGRNSRKFVHGYPDFADDLPE